MKNSQGQILMQMGAAVFIVVAAAMCMYSVSDLLTKQLITQSVTAPVTALQTHSVSQSEFSGHSSAVGFLCDFTKIN